MAISDDLPGVEVAITVNGQDLREYIDPDLDEDDRTTTRYIEAASGQAFAIQTKVPKGFKFVANSLVFRMHIDGRWVSGPLVSKETCRFAAGHTIIEGKRVSDTQLQKFQFGSLETVSDGRMMHGEATRVKDLGTILVEVSQVKKMRKTSRDPKVKDVKDVGFVSEKALKGQAISHSVKFSKPEMAPADTFWETKDVPGYEDPVARFVFKYRSIENFKIEGIIPRTPTPAPLEDRDFDTLTSEELRELHRRAKAFRDEQEAKIKIKREKVEEHTRRRKVARPGPGATQLEADEDGDFRESSATTMAKEQDVIELD